MEERLQKIIARAGIVSRRKAEEYIAQGRVRVNGQIISILGAKADPASDHIKVDGKLLRPESFEYYAVHKPRSVLSAASDDRGRPVVVDLVHSGKRLYPAGRLDFNSEGLVILTNDGELAERIMRAGTTAKVYRVKVRGQPEERKLDRLRKGIRVEGEKLAPCQIQTRKIDNNCWLEVVLRQGQNRQIRRMFEAIGHPVMRLRRVAIGPVKLGRLAPRTYRALTLEEVSYLKSGRTSTSGSGNARRSRSPSPRSNASGRQRRRSLSRNKTRQSRKST